MLVPCPSMDEISQWMESIEELDGGCKWPVCASVGTSTPDTIEKVVVVIVPLFSGRASVFDIVLLLLILIVLAAQCLLPEV